jgi:hypothetical protein
MQRECPPSIGGLARWNTEELELDTIAPFDSEPVVIRRVTRGAGFRSLVVRFMALDARNLAGVGRWTDIAMQAESPKERIDGVAMARLAGREIIASQRSRERGPENHSLRDGVARRALDARVMDVEDESPITAMIEAFGAPNTRARVTRFTSTLALPVWILMTRIARLRRSGESRRRIQSRRIPRMTRAAGRGSMRPKKVEVGFAVMIEVWGAVTPRRRSMARFARSSDRRGVRIRMARGTAGVLDAEVPPSVPGLIPRVTSATVERLVSAVEAEIGEVVLERGVIDRDDRSAVIGVAAGTASPQPTVESVGFVQRRSNWLVAGETLSIIDSAKSLGMAALATYESFVATVSRMKSRLRQQNRERLESETPNGGSGSLSRLGRDRVGDDFQQRSILDRRHREESRDDTCREHDSECGPSSDQRRGRAFSRYTTRRLSGLGLVPARMMLPGVFERDPSVEHRSERTPGPRMDGG